MDSVNKNIFLQWVVLVVIIIGVGFIAVQVQGINSKLIAKIHLLSPLKKFQKVHILF